MQLAGVREAVGDAGFDAAVPAGGATGFGFQASYSGRNVNPTAFTLNGRPCTAV